MASPADIVPDTKDWTWVLEKPCPDCGYDAATIAPHSIGTRTRELAGRWPAVLRRLEVRDRPSPEAWSALEYGCHTRDVFAIFDRRLASMLAGDPDGPPVQFDNWDQDRTAVQSRYGEQDPADVAAALVEGGERIAARFDGVSGAQWDRTALRSDGARFTTTSLGRYFLHDVVHHLYDVGADATT